MLSIETRTILEKEPGSRTDNEVHMVSREENVTERDKLILSLVWCRVEIVVILRLIRIQQLVYPLTLSFIPIMMLFNKSKYIYLIE